MDSYVFSDVTNDIEDPTFVKSWRSLLSQSASAQKIYQSPEFFAFLKADLHSARDRLVCFSVKERATGNLVGVIPMRSIDLTLDIPVTSSFKIPIRLPAFELLGSDPLMPRTAQIVGEFFGHLRKTFFPTPVLSMQALKGSSGLFQILKKMEQSSPLLKMSVIHGFRDCHVTELPRTYAEYQAKFSSKKRYNLNRQIRLLKESIPGLRLTRIQDPSDVPALLRALDKFVPGAGDPRRMPDSSYEELARRGLLLCYVLEDDNQAYGLIKGNRYGDVYHVSYIKHDAAYHHLSVGTSILHMAIEDLVEALQIARVDFGYGNPTYQYESSNHVEQRGRVVLSSRRMMVQAVLSAHEAHRRLVDYGKRWVGAR